MYPPAPQNPGPHPSAALYSVIVEEKRRENSRWYISLIQPAGGDLTTARATGQSIAFQHQPHTAGDKVGRRDVYQVGEDSWLVSYAAPWRLGGMGHFRVSVARHIGSIG
jgi:hypothetical protein